MYFFITPPIFLGVNLLTLVILLFITLNFDG